MFATLIHKLLDELDQAKLSLSLCYRDEVPDEKAVLACKARIISLDDTIAYYMARS